VDAGDKLGGAMKDDWASYVRHEKEDTAKASVATLWPRPDWHKLIDEVASKPDHTQGTARQLAATLYVVREMAVEHQQRNGAFGNKVRQRDDDIPALKARYLSELQTWLRRCFTDPGLQGMAAAVYSYAYYLAGGGVPYEHRDHDESLVDPQEIERKADKIIAAAGVEPRAAVSASVGYGKSEAQRAYFAKEIDREAFQKRYDEEQREARRNARVPALVAEVAKLLKTDWPDAMPRRGRRRTLAPLPVRPKLERLERIGPARRDGLHVAPEAIIKAFAVRGVEFGNWVTPAERQANIDLAYDALHDLAEVLGIRPQDIGRSKLGIGFGSRGRGASGGIAAAAHYEPNRIVINLTRMMGDGSLAHEMGHMFEHSLVGFSFKPSDGSTGRKKRSHGSFPSTSWVGFWKTSERPKLLEDERLDAAFWRVLDAIMRADPDQTGPWRSSSYYSNASRLGKYWSAPLEMFARAFECYVYDWLQEHGRISEYLVHGVEGDRFERGFRGNPYLTGEERQRINAAMAELIEVWRGRGA